MKNKIMIPLAAVAVVGVSVLTGFATLASAQSGNVASTSTSTERHMSKRSAGHMRGPHVGANGTKEQILTGPTAESVKAAVLAANPGATIHRVETDADGAVYEAHIKKSDGSRATVKLDARFVVTGIEDGPGPRRK